MSELSVFRKATGKTQAELASQLGVTQPMLSKIERGEALPGLKLAVAIERLTAGAVPAHSWVPETPEGDAA